MYLLIHQRGTGVNTPSSSNPKTPEGTLHHDNWSKYVAFDRWWGCFSAPAEDTQQSDRIVPEMKFLIKLYDKYSHFSNCKVTKEEKVLNLFSCVISGS